MLLHKLDTLNQQDPLTTGKSFGTIGALRIGAVGIEPRLTTTVRRGSSYAWVPASREEVRPSPEVVCKKAVIHPTL